MLFYYLKCFLEYWRLIIRKISPSAILLFCPQHQMELINIMRSYCSWQVSFVVLVKLCSFVLYFRFMTRVLNRLFSSKGKRILDYIYFACLGLSCDETGNSEEEDRVSEWKKGFRIDPLITLVKIYISFSFLCFSIK